MIGESHVPKVQGDIYDLMITDNYRYAMVGVYCTGAGLGMAAAYGGIELLLVVSESNNW